MTRPKCCREIAAMPGQTCFHPEGADPSSLVEVLLTLDEYEALRLADFEGMYQEQAALRMNISRQTFGRIIEAAHRKVADVLVNGKILKIEGGPVSMKAETAASCPRCRQAIRPVCGRDSEMGCPHCSGQGLHQTVQKGRRS